MTDTLKTTKRRLDPDKPIEITLIPKDDPFWSSGSRIIVGPSSKRVSVNSPRNTPVANTQLPKSLAAPELAPATKRGESNRLVTRQEYEEALARVRKKLGRQVDLTQAHPAVKMTQRPPLPVWLKWILGIAAIVAFLWLDSSPQTAPVLNLTFGWALRAWVAFASWSVADTVFRDSVAPWRTAMKGLAVVIAVATFAALQASCTSDPSCDPDPIYGGCSSICDSVPLIERARVGALSSIFVGLPLLAAGWKQRRRFVTAKTLTASQSGSTL